MEKNRDDITTESISQKQMVIIFNLRVAQSLLVQVSLAHDVRVQVLHTVFRSGLAVTICSSAGRDLFLFNSHVSWNFRKHRNQNKHETEKWGKNTIAIFLTVDSRNINLRPCEVPIDLDKFRVQLTSPYQTKPPAFRILSFSAARLGLWSLVELYACNRDCN